MLAKSKRLIVEEWSTGEKVQDDDGNITKMSVKDIEDFYVKRDTAQMLENIYSDYGNIDQDIGNLFETSQAGSTLDNIGGTTDGAANSTSYQFQPIVLALVRRSFPELFAHKVVGVQAMNGPVGLAYAIRKIYSSNNTDEVEAAWEQIDRWAGYTGNQRQTSGALSQEQSGIYDTSATGIAATSAEDWEIKPGGTYPELKIKTDKKTIEAKTRKLATSYSLESAQDLKTMLGIDIEREMVDTLQYELIAELDREILYRMKKAAVTTSLDGSLITAVNVSGTAIDGRWSQEKFSNILNAISYQKNRIATLTRQGAGNFACVSPAVATALESAPPGVFTRNDAKIAQRAGVAEIGSIMGGSVAVHRDSHARTDYALVGYKGPTPKETGIVYCPYLLGITNRAMAQEDFSPRIGTMMRYDIVDNMLGSGRYYRLIPFTNMSEIIVTA